MGHPHLIPSRTSNLRYYPQITVSHDWPRERLNELSHSIFASQLFPERGQRIISMKIWITKEKSSLGSRQKVMSFHNFLMTTK
jgi:hypothetical protein